MRGFLHVIEVIVIVVVAFVLFYQFSVVPQQQEDWARVRLAQQAADIIHVLDLQGADWFNGTNVSGTIASLFSGTSLVTAVSLKNALPPVVSVGCVCDAAEFSLVSNFLTPVRMNSQNVSFAVTQIPTTSPVIDFTNEVTINFGHDLSSVAAAIQSYVQQGRGLILVRDLSQGDFATDPLLTPVFGLVWNSSTAFIHPVGGKVIQFTDNPNSRFRNIRRYFESLPIVADDFTSGGMTHLQPFSGSWIVQQVNGDEQLNGTQNIAIGPNISFANITPASSVPENYSASFTLNTTSVTAALSVELAGWSFGYVNDFNFSFAGVDPSAKQLHLLRWGTGDDAYKAITFATGSAYRFQIGKRGYGLRVGVINQSGGVSFLTFNATGPFSGSPGLLAVNTSNLFDHVRLSYLGNNFANFLTPDPAAEQVDQADSDASRIILRQEGTGAPALIVNDGYGSGRTAWLSTGAENRPDGQTLLKALVLWATGEAYSPVPASIPAEAVRASLITVYDRDYYQPVQVELSLGKVF